MDITAVLEMGRELSNWGRWGPNDEIGTLNYITPEKIARAGTLVRQGKSFGLAIAFDSRGPQSGSGARFNPILTMLTDGADAEVGAQDRIPGRFRYADDMVVMALQGATHWDSLAHVFYDGQMYNGFESRLITSKGAQKNSITKTKDKIVSRGVLLDIPRSKGIDWLDPGYAITVEDLESCASSQKVEVEAADILLIRTGHQTLCREKKSWVGYAGGDAPGLSLMTAPWLHQKRIAGLATDTWGVEVRPNEVLDCFQPFHLVALRNMGLLLGEMFNLDDVAFDCASDRVYEFLFVGPPLPFTGAVGSPVNPMAIK